MYRPGHRGECRGHEMSDGDATDQASCGSIVLPRLRTKSPPSIDGAQARLRGLACPMTSAQRGLGAPKRSSDGRIWLQCRRYDKWLSAWPFMCYRMHDHLATSIKQIYENILLTHLS